MSWIYEHKDWPKFYWDSTTVHSKLSDIRYKQGLLLGQMKGLGFIFQQEVGLNTLTTEIVKSSAIEGEGLNPKEVRSSIAKQLGMNIGGLTQASRHVEGIVEMMLDATQNHANKLTKTRLFGWHGALFPTGYSQMKKIAVGAWRSGSKGPMQVVSGIYGKEAIHFQAPDAAALNEEMKVYLNWLEKNKDASQILKAGIAHFWFVTIHPLEDGNGRIGRAICEMLLARSDQSKHRFYSMAAQIEQERQKYYAKLEAQQRSGLDMTPWLIWFLDCLERAIDSADKNLLHVLYKSKLWNKLNEKAINDRQRKVIDKLLSGFEGKLTREKYVKITKCSVDSAKRDIQDFLKRRVLIKNPGGGRSTSYRLITNEELKDG